MDANSAPKSTWQVAQKRLFGFNALPCYGFLISAWYENKYQTCWRLFSIFGPQENKKCVWMYCFSLFSRLSSHAQFERFLAKSQHDNKENKIYYLHQRRTTWGFIHDSIKFLKKTREIRKMAQFHRSKEGCLHEICTHIADSKTTIGKSYWVRAKSVMWLRLLRRAIIAGNASALVCI